MEFHYKIIYESWWKKQVMLGNIPDRDISVRCRCHINIMNDILYTTVVDQLDASTEYNKPNKRFQCIQKGVDKVKWMLEALQVIYDNTIFGEQCMIDVMYVHRIFWNILKEEDRKEIREYISNQPTIIKDEEVVFKWIGGWKLFSKIMCIVYQKSFEYKEVH